jgi:hypothetical protein
MLHTYTLHAFYMDVMYGCNGFQLFSGVFLSVSEACFKYFLYLQTYITTVVFGCFKSRSGVASLLLGMSSSRHRQGIHMTPQPGLSKSKALPLPLLLFGRRRPHVERAKQSAARRRPDIRTLALRSHLRLTRQCNETRGTQRSR